MSAAFFSASLQRISHILHYSFFIIFPTLYSAMRKCSGIDIFCCAKFDISSDADSIYASHSICHFVTRILQGISEAPSLRAAEGRL